MTRDLETGDQVMLLGRTYRVISVWPTAYRTGDDQLYFLPGRTLIQRTTDRGTIESFTTETEGLALIHKDIENGTENPTGA